MSYTIDPNDKRLGHGPDKEPTPQNEVYLILSEEERVKGFVNPVYRSYTHKKCGVSTKMGIALCETYARDPKFYGATYCVGCGMHLPVNQFVWDNSGGLTVGDFKDANINK